MPKLPTWGGLDYQRAEHPNAPLDLDGYGRGTQALGAALFKTGATIARAAEDQADKEDKLTQANAGSTLLLGIGELKKKAEEDRDPNDFAQRYEPQVKKLYEQSFASIRDPYQRQLFEARMRPHMQTDIDAFTKRGKTLRDDVDKAGSDQRLFGIGQAMDATKDDAEKQRLMGEARREIDGRVQRGWLTLEQAGEIKRDWANKRGVTWVMSKPPAERMRILETRPTPTGLVPPVNGTFVGGPASRFGARRGISRLHAGVDWQAPNGSPAASAIDGKVVYTGNHSGYGNMVDVLGADGNVHRYALHEGDVGVKIGDAVKAGQQIGTVGGGHVHNEIIRKDTPAWQAATAGTFGGTSRRPGSESQTIDPAEVYGLKPGTKVSSSAALPPAARRDHPIIGMLAPGQRQVLYERAVRANIEDRYTVSQLLKNDESSIISTGKPLEGLTDERVKGSLGDTAYQRWKDQRAFNKEVYDATSGLAGMSIDEIHGRVLQLRATADAARGKPGADRAQRLFDAVNSKAQQVATSRLTDPAFSVAEAPEVQAAQKKHAAKPDDPHAQQEIIAARLVAQERLGVPRALQRPLPQDELKPWISALRPMARKQADLAGQAQAFDAFASTIVEKYGDHAEGVMKQVLSSLSLSDDASEVLAAAMIRARKNSPGAIIHQDEMRRVVADAYAAMMMEAMGVYGSQNMPPQDMFDAQNTGTGERLTPLEVALMKRADVTRYWGASASGSAGAEAGVGGGAQAAALGYIPPPGYEPDGAVGDTAPGRGRAPAGGTPGIERGPQAPGEGDVPLVPGAGTYGDVTPEQPQRASFTDALRLLASDPEKYVEPFRQRYGWENVPRQYQGLITKTPGWKVPPKGGFPLDIPGGGLGEVAPPPENARPAAKPAAAPAEDPAKQAKKDGQRLMTMIEADPVAMLPMAVLALGRGKLPKELFDKYGDVGDGDEDIPALRSEADALALVQRDPDRYLPGFAMLFGTAAVPAALRGRIDETTQAKLRARAGGR